MQLNDLILEGRMLDALDRFYADDVVMQENLAAPTCGKAANLAREKAFLSNVERMNKTALIGSAVKGDMSYSEWEYDMTLKDGKRLHLSEVAARRWKNGKVVHERCYYDSGQS